MLILEARTIEVSWADCEENIDLDYTDLVYLQYDGENLGYEDVCKYTVKSNDYDKRMCVLVQKFYVDAAHAASTKVEYHKHLYTSLKDKVT